MEITQQLWGMTPDGEAAILYTMRNGAGAEVTLTNIGAAVAGIRVPDREGQIGDVILGYRDMESYIGDAAMMGKIVGRTTGRMGGATFMLDGRAFRLTRNAPPLHTDGGAGGFGNRVWTSRVETDRVVFAYLSPDGEEGYPGELGCEVAYDWNDDNELEITVFARASEPTVVNIASNIYFNLAGAGSVLGHELRLNAERFLATDRLLVATGELLDIARLPMDFRAAKPLGRDIDADYESLLRTGGYDHCWAVEGWHEGELRNVGELHDPVSGRTVTISSTQPGVQVYTGNLLAGGAAGHHGRPYADREGVVVRCQGFPNAPNIAAFPSQRLDPDRIYMERTVYRLGVAASACKK
ncbi:MAG: galactose mutarotase [Rikenellaceae bacterium]|nr:galactose mutarotase [Rikenellaceae bacterium]MCL2693360.1 galactose mutarotase [Rikenellaceae bacterium]